MRPASLVTLALLAGCATSLPDADTLVVDVQVATAVVGGKVPFTFANQSSEEVVTGALDCVVSYERREGPAWVRHDPLRACIDLAELHAPGSTRSYQTTAPEDGGLWRLVVEAWAGSGPGRNIVTARSQPFGVLDDRR